MNLKAKATPLGDDFLSIETGHVGSHRSSSVAGCRVYVVIAAAEAVCLVDMEVTQLLGQLEHHARHLVQEVVEAEEEGTCKVKLARNALARNTT